MVDERTVALHHVSSVGTLGSPGALEGAPRFGGLPWLFSHTDTARVTAGTICDTLVTSLV